MATIFLGGRTFRSMLVALTASASLAATAPGGVQAQPARDAPKTMPQDAQVASPDNRPGETLTEQLDRNKGVIHPPRGVDPGIAVPVPDPNPRTTPVIPPPGSSGGNPSVQPK